MPDTKKQPKPYKRYFSMAANAGKAEILLYEQIGQDPWDGTGQGAKDFAAALKALGPVSEIVVRINSPGGDVFEGQAIYTQLAAHPATKVVCIDGLAASIASVVAMAGDTICMPENAMMMVHDPSGIVWGTADEMRKMADSMDKIKQSLVAVYCNKTGKSEDEISALLAAETWMTAQDALEMGFCDEVGEPVALAATFDLSKFSNVPPALASLRQSAAADTRKQATVQQRRETMPEKDDKKGGAAVLENEAEIRTEEQKKEGARVSAIYALGKRHDCDEAMITAAVGEGITEEQFSKRILDTRYKDAKPLKTGDPVITQQKADAKPFRSFGEQLMAIAQSARAQKQGKSPDKRLLEIHRSFQDAIQGASESVPSDGGWLVQTDFAAELYKRSYELGALTSRVTKVPISAGSNGMKMNAVDETSRATGSRWGGVQVYRVDEGAAGTAKKPKFAKMEWTLKKLMGLYYATDELLQDAAALQSVALQAFSEEMAFVMDDEIMRGDGANQMLGYLNAGGLVTVSKESGQTATTFKWENAVKMWARMWARSRANAVWLINQDVETQLYSMSLAVGTGGVPVFMPSGGASGSPYASLFGRPIIPVEQCATLGTVGDVQLVDLSQYLMIEKGGLDVQMSIHVEFLTDQQVFRFIIRNDGQPLWRAPLTPYKGTNTLGPFVVLATRA